MNDQPPQATEAFDLGRGLQHGFAALRRCFPVLFVGGCLKGCTEGGGGGGGNVQESFDSFKNGGGGAPDPSAIFDQLGIGSIGRVEIAVIAVTVLVVMVVALAFRAWILPGWVRLHAEVIRTGEGQFGTLLGAGDVFGTSVTWAVVEGLMYVTWIALIAAPFALIFSVPESQHAIVGAVASIWGLAMIPLGIYMMLSTVFVNHVIALEGLGVVDAVARSFDLAAGNRLWLAVYTFVYWILAVVMAIAGLCLCCVGTLVTQPVGIVLRDFGFTEGFLRLTRPGEEVSGWSVNEWGGR